jgi:hypothetical protein
MNPTAATQDSTLGVSDDLRAHTIPSHSSHT